MESSPIRSCLLHQQIFPNVDFDSLMHSHWSQTALRFFFFSPVTLFNLYRSFCSSCIFQFESLVIIIIFFWLCGVQERKKKNVHNFFVIPDFSLLMWKPSTIFLKLARYLSDVPFQIKINSIQSLIRNPYTSVWSKSSKTLKKK